MDNLTKWNLIVVDWCCMCKKSGEMVDHLLLHCEVARALWNSVFGLCARQGTTNLQHVCLAFPTPRVIVCVTIIDGTMQIQKLPFFFRLLARKKLELLFHGIPNSKLVMIELRFLCKLVMIDFFSCITV
jgi:hypothetical protein